MGSTGSSGWPRGVTRRLLVPAFWSDSPAWQGGIKDEAEGLWPGQGWGPQDPREPGGPEEAQGRKTPAAGEGLLRQPECREQERGDHGSY